MTYRESEAERLAAELAALQHTSVNYNMTMCAVTALGALNESVLSSSRVHCIEKSASVLFAHEFVVQRAPVRIPVNALYLELVHARRHPLLRHDMEYNRSLCRALRPHAVEAERALRAKAISEGVSCSFVEGGRWGLKLNGCCVRSVCVF